MKKQEKGPKVIDFLIGGIVLFGIYSLVTSGTKEIVTREQAINVILHYNPNANTSTLQTADLGYVIARATAYQNAQPVFIFAGVRYRTDSGTAA